MHKVSVIIPLFNTELYIEDCINSVLSQTKVITEIIIVDDGSTDQGPNIVKGIASLNSNVMFIKNKRQKGVSGARNTGIEESTGDLIVFLDSDDLLLENSLYSRASLLIKENVNVVSCDFVQFRQISELNDEGYIKRALQNNGFENIEKQIKIEDPIQFFLEKLCLVWTGSIMVTRDHLVSTGYFKEDITHGEDEEMWYRLLVDQKLAYTSLSLAAYRLRPLSASTNLKKRYIGAVVLRLMQIKTKLLPHKYKHLLIKKLIREFNTLESYLRATNDFQPLISYSLSILAINPFSARPWKSLICGLLKLK